MIKENITALREYIEKETGIKTYFSWSSVDEANKSVDSSNFDKIIILDYSNKPTIENVDNCKCINSRRKVLIALGGNQKKHIADILIAQEVLEKSLVKLSFEGFPEDQTDKQSQSLVDVLYKGNYFGGVSNNQAIEWYVFELEILERISYE